MTVTATIDTLADAVRAKHTRRIDVERWQEPKHAHLLRSPSAFVDAVMAELSDDGTRGDPLPWAKCARDFRLRSHELTVWAGANASAKSTLLSEVMLSLATAGKRVVIVSLEMPAYKVAAKLAVQAFANPHPARGRVEAWAESLGETLCFLDLTGDIEPAEAVKMARYCAHELNTQHFLLDNLTKVVSADNEHAEQQRQFMARMHRAAIDTGLHVHVVAHTRKPGGHDEDRPPGRYEVAGSRTLVDQPDNVVMLWRNRPKERKREKGEIGALEEGSEPDLLMRVEKQRHGRYEGGIGLWMDRRTFRFVDRFGGRPAAYWE
jgi:twinkle protein